MDTLELVANNLGYRFSKDSPWLFRNLSLKILLGQTVALIAPSGGGKSTLLRILAGLVEPEEGSVELLNQERIGFVFQDQRLLPWKTALQNIEYAIEKNDNRKNFALNLLARVGLSGKESRYPHQLSGGEQQRVQIARALAVKPKVMLLDEPFSGLDYKTRTEIRELLKEIQSVDNFATVLVTHDSVDIAELDALQMTLLSLVSSRL